MKKVFIIEDEKINQDEILWHLKEFPEIELLAICESVEEALQAFDQHKPDLVFMDIELRDGKSFEILEKLATHQKRFDIIFITAFDQYALTALKSNAMDYLLKPIDTEEFNAAVKKSLSAKQENYPINKLVLRTQQEIFFIEFDHIVYLKGESAYTTVHTLDGKNIVVSKTLKDFETQLPNDFFLRVHKSYIVNMHQIASYKRNGTLILKQHQEIPVSTRKKDFLLDKLNVNG